MSSGNANLSGGQALSDAMSRVIGYPRPRPAARRYYT